MGARVSVTNWRWMRDDGGASTPLSFELAPGERVLLRGRSGAGKSTLLAAIAGLAGHNAESRSPDGASFVGVVTEGSIRLDGDEVSHNRRGSGAVGLLLQDPLTQAVMSRIGDDVAFGLENLGVDPADMPERIRTALDSVALNLSLDTPTDKLSGGQRQRLALAGVLAMRPSLLLLDEPTANLDPEGARLIRLAVERAVNEHGLTLVVVDHTPGFWSDVVEREIELTAVDDDPPARTDRAIVVTSATPATVPSLTPVPTKRPAATLARATSLAVGYPRAPLAQRELSFEVVAGRILVVSGPNGAGKSALALTLAKLIPARGGELTFFQTKPRIGLVFQTPEHQFIGATVRTDVSAGLRPTRRARRTSRTTTRLEREDRVDGVLQEFRLERLAQRHPFALSGGEKRRLSIADVVVTADADEPSILIFDEPSTGQDEQSWHDLVESLRGLARVGHALVVITHDERLAASIGDDRLELSP